MAAEHQLQQKQVERVSRRCTGALDGVGPKSPWRSALFPSSGAIRAVFEELSLKDCALAVDEGGVARKVERGVGDERPNASRDAVLPTPSDTSTAGAHRDSTVAGWNSSVLPVIESLRPQDMDYESERQTGEVGRARDGGRWAELAGGWQLQEVTEESTGSN